MDTRNPYLLLGIDYGTSPDLARRSFARAARRVRRSPGSAISIEDLNWALHEIQNQQDDPADSVTTFRVPADPAVFHPEGEGIFAPSPITLTRRTEPSESDVDALVNAQADDVATLVTALCPSLVSFDFGYAQGEDNG